MDLKFCSLSATKIRRKIINNISHDLHAPLHADAHSFMLKNCNLCHRAWTNFNTVSIDLGTVFWLSKTQYDTHDLNSCIYILVPVPNFIKKPRSVFFLRWIIIFFYMIPADKTHQNASFIPLCITKRTLIKFFVYATVINFRSLWLTMFNYFFFGRGGGINTTSLFISGL